ncbi:MAG: hypothetical protein WC877_01940 [Dehalococcoidales bacterium]|jgi:hypothetical protein
MTEEMIAVPKYIIDGIIDSYNEMINCPIKEWSEESESMMHGYINSLERHVNKKD